MTIPADEPGKCLLRKEVGPVTFKTLAGFQEAIFTRVIPMIVDLQLRVKALDGKQPGVASAELKAVQDEARH